MRRLHRLAPGILAHAAQYLEREPTALRVALVAGILLAFQDHVDRTLSIVVMGVLCLTLVGTIRLRLGLFAIALFAASGVAMRVAYLHVSQSDVLSVTQQAIDIVRSGGDPYAAVYAGTFPGEPFPYGPLELLWYLPWRDPAVFEFALSIVLLAVLALRGRPVGLVGYALFQQLLLTASDGSNETSAGLLLLIALVVLPRSPFWGAVLLAVASAFKPYAIAWLPGLVAWAPLPALLGFGAGAIVAWSPVLLVWGVPTFLASLGQAEVMHYVEAPFESLGQVVQVVTGWTVEPAVIDRLRLVLGGAAALALVPLASSGRRVVLIGIVVYLVTLYSGYWSTFGYLAAIAPIVCWNVDDWLGMGAGRIRLPGDLAGRITGAVDDRWPIQVRKSPLSGRLA